MVFTEMLEIRTHGDTDVIDLTDKVASIVARSGVKTGIVAVFVMHTTAAITTSEYEPALVKDLKEEFEKLAPQSADYQHNHDYDDNGHAHIRASLLGASLTLPLDDGELTLGQWQSIVLLDFDNHARVRKINVKVIGD